MTLPKMHFFFLLFSRISFRTAAEWGGNRKGQSVSLSSFNSFLSDTERGNHLFFPLTLTPLLSGGAITGNERRPYSFLLLSLFLIPTFLFLLPLFPPWSLLLWIFSSKLKGGRRLLAFTFLRSSSSACAGPSLPLPWLV